MTIEFEREVDGRWLAEIKWRRGICLMYGKTRLTALARALWAFVY